MRSKSLLFAVVLGAVAVTPAAASLVGSAVTGSLTFAGDPTNYFDPGNGFVPAAGFLNQTSSTVTVSASGVEFGFDDGSSQISADLSDNRIVISDLIELDGPTNSFEITLTDSAFLGSSLSAANGNLPLNGYSLSGDVITIDYPGCNPAAGQEFTETFLVVAVPEPATSNLVFGSIALAFLGFHRFKKLNRANCVCSLGNTKTGARFGSTR